jgi:hypothetical protein|tara:strand:+ start:193 stop:429 length:237 start_codon:yes stop_codon:yes gene_type:complete
MIERVVRGKSGDLRTTSLIMVYMLSKALAISPLEVYKMPSSLVIDLLSVHGVIEKIKAEEIDSAKNKMSGVKNVGNFR